MRFWSKILLALVLLWAVVGGAVFWARASRPTAKSVAEFVHTHDVQSLSGSDRARAIQRLEEMLNSISFEESQQMQRDGTTREFFKKLTPDEQSAFLDATLPAGFKQMMESFNNMTPERRKKFVDGALEEMKKHEGEGPPPNVDEKMAQKMIDQGMRSFYSDANADVKLDMAPLIEQMQKNMQSPR